MSRIICWERWSPLVLAQKINTKNKGRLELDRYVINVFMHFFHLKKKRWVVIILVKNQCTRPDKKGFNAVLWQHNGIAVFILNEEMFCLKFEQKFFRSPTFLPYILCLICMFEKCQKDSALVSLNVILLLNGYVLPVYFYYSFSPDWNV